MLYIVYHNLLDTYKIAQDIPVTETTGTHLQTQDNNKLHLLLSKYYFCHNFYLYHRGANCCHESI